MRPPKRFSRPLSSPTSKVYIYKYYHKAVAPARALDTKRVQDTKKISFRHFREGSLDVKVPKETSTIPLDAKKDTF